MDQQSKPLKEQIVSFGNANSLKGIVTQPLDLGLPDRPAIVLFNAGILHRVGPNRLNVSIARNLARNNYRALRFDLGGYGYSASSEQRDLVGDCLAAMDFLEQHYDQKKFVLIGICTGARVALETAYKDKRIKALVLVEGPVFPNALYHFRRLFNFQKWKKLFLGKSFLLQKLSGKKTSMQSPLELDLMLQLKNTSATTSSQKIDALVDRSVDLLLLYRGGNEIRYGYWLQKEGPVGRGSGAQGKMTLAFIEGADHTFTPLKAQALLKLEITNWLSQIQ